MKYKTLDPARYDVPVFVIEERVGARDEPPTIELSEFKARRTAQMYLVLIPGDQLGRSGDQEVRVSHGVVDDGKRPGAFRWGALGVGLTREAAIARAIEREDERLTSAERGIIATRKRGERILSQLDALRREHA